MDLTRPGGAAHACRHGVAVQATETMPQRAGGAQASCRVIPAWVRRFGGIGEPAISIVLAAASPRRGRGPMRPGARTFRCAHGPERDAVRVAHLVHFPKKLRWRCWDMRLVRSLHTRGCVCTDIPMARCTRSRNCRANFSTLGAFSRAATPALIPRRAALGRITAARSGQHDRIWRRNLPRRDGQAEGEPFARPSTFF
jgi:hypothetical protein